MQWHVAMRPGRRRLLEQGGARWLREREKASVRAKVEHPFLYVKRRFGYRKVRYRGLAKNMERIALLLGFANLLVAAAIRRRERPARETSAHAGRNEGIIGQNMPVGRVFSPSSPPRPLKPAPSVPHRPQKGLAQSFPRPASSSSATNSPSFNVVTPSFSAFSCLEPGSSPTTT